jgi:hypothetical protein
VGTNRLPAALVRVSDNPLVAPLQHRVMLLLHRHILYFHSSNRYELSSTVFEENYYKYILRV